MDRFTEPQHRLCAYRNEAKSQPHMEGDKLVNQEGKDYCDFDKKYIDFAQQCSAGESRKWIIEVFCKKCDRKLCMFRRVKDSDINDEKELEIVDFWNTDNLLAFRQRADGLLGLECICGEGDTRLSNIEKNRHPEKFPVWTFSSSPNAASWKHNLGHFRYNRRKDKS